MSTENSTIDKKALTLLGLRLSLAIVTGVTLIGVWRSILDPWGWFLENTNALFFPSLTIFLAALVLIAHEEDTLRLGAGPKTIKSEP